MHAWKRRVFFCGPIDEKVFLQRSPGTHHPAAPAAPIILFTNWYGMDPPCTLHGQLAPGALSVAPSTRQPVPNLNSFLAKISEKMLPLHVMTLRICVQSPQDFQVWSENLQCPAQFEFAIFAYPAPKKSKLRASPFKKISLLCERAASKNMIINWIRDSIQKQQPLPCSPRHWTDLLFLADLPLRLALLKCHATRSFIPSFQNAHGRRQWFSPWKVLCQHRLERGPRDLNPRGGHSSFSTIPWHQKGFASTNAKHAAHRLFCCTCSTRRRSRRRPPPNLLETHAAHTIQMCCCYGTQITTKSERVFLSANHWN